MALKPAQEVTRCHIPQNERRIRGTGERLRSIRAERHAFDSIRVSFKGTDNISRIDVPENNGYIVRTGERFRPIRAKGDAPYTSRIPLKTVAHPGESGGVRQSTYGVFRRILKPVRF